jgi:hypothetical protein
MQLSLRSKMSRQELHFTVHIGYVSRVSIINTKPELLQFQQRHPAADDMVAMLSVNKDKDQQR